MQLTKAYGHNYNCSLHHENTYNWQLSIHQSKSVRLITSWCKSIEQTLYHRNLFIYYFLSPTSITSVMLSPLALFHTYCTQFVLCSQLQSVSCCLRRIYIVTKRLWQKLAVGSDLKLALKVGKLVDASLPSISWGPARWHVGHITLIKCLASRHKEYMLSRFLGAHNTQLIRQKWHTAVYVLLSNLDMVHSKMVKPRNQEQ